MRFRPPRSTFVMPDVPPGAQVETSETLPSFSEVTRSNRNRARKQLNLGGEKETMLKSGAGVWSAVMMAAVVAVPTNMAAQESDRFVGISAGPSQYDLSGTGTEAAFGLRFETPLNPWLVFETAVTHLEYKSQSRVTVRHVFPEAQVQLHRTSGALRPYLGVGGGASWRSTSAGNSFDPTLSVAGGVRIPLGADWRAQGELRVRAVDPWTGTTADWGIGIARRW